nr:ATP-binding cassette domain-containing protein [uncultured Cohaesibacter sp.]
MIEISNLRLHFSNRRILDNVSFTLEKGETLALIGESGGGKTSLARLLLRLLNGKPFDENERATLSRPKGFHWSGSAHIDGLNILHADTKDIKQIRGKKIGLIAQALSDALNPHLTVAQHIEEISRKIGPMEQSARDICIQFNIPVQLCEQYPSRLSGGEIQRVLSALALIRKPDYLILDEPTASLDPANREIAIETFSKESRTRGQILITHDLALARQLADRVAVLYQGRVVEEGKTAEIFRCPKRHYTGTLVQACHRNPECAAGKARPNQIADGVSPKALHTSRQKPDPQGLSIRHVSHHYENHLVLDDISASVPIGSCLGIVGPSGCGKSTLAKLLVGQLPIKQGTILWKEGRNSLLPAQVRPALVSQHPHRAMAHHFSVFEVLREALVLDRKRTARFCLKHKHDFEGEVFSLLEQVGLSHEPDFLSRKTAALSGGEAQRLIIARALSTKPSYLVLDEPTSALDMCARSQILSLLAELISKQSLTTIIFTHDLDAAHFLANQIYNI